MPKIRISREIYNMLDDMAKEEEWPIEHFLEKTIEVLYLKHHEEKASTALAKRPTPTTEIQRFTPEEKKQYQEDVFNGLRCAVETRAIQYIIEQIKMTSGTANPVERAKDILKDLSLIFGQELSQERLDMALRNQGTYDLYNSPGFGFQDIAGLI